MVDQIEDKIRARAQEFWEEEGRPSGKAEEHWRRASEELSGISTDSQPDASSGASRISSSLQPGGTTTAGSQSSIGNLDTGGGSTAGAAIGNRKKA